MALSCYVKEADYNWQNALRSWKTEMDRNTEVFSCGLLAHLVDHRALPLINLFQHRTNVRAKLINLFNDVFLDINQTHAQFSAFHVKQVSYMFTLPFNRIVRLTDLRGCAVYCKFMYPLQTEVPWYGTIYCRLKYRFIYLPPIWIVNIGTLNNLTYLTRLETVNLQN